MDKQSNQKKSNYKSIFLYGLQNPSHNHKICKLPIYSLLEIVNDF